jgi:hypothetical protein
VLAGDALGGGVGILLSKSSSYALKRATRSASAVRTAYAADHSPGRITVMRASGPKRCRR